MAQISAATQAAIAAGKPSPTLSPAPKIHKSGHTAAARLASSSVPASRRLVSGTSAPPAQAAAAPSAHAAAARLLPAHAQSHVDERRPAELHDDQPGDPAADDLEQDEDPGAAAEEQAAAPAESEQHADDDMDHDEYEEDEQPTFDWATSPHLLDIHPPDAPHLYNERVSPLVVASGILPQYGFRVRAISRHATVQGVSGIHSTVFKSVAQQPHQLVHNAVMFDGVVWPPGTMVDKAERTIKAKMQQQGLSYLLPVPQGREDLTDFIQVHPIHGTTEASSSFVLHCASPDAARELLTYKRTLSLQVYPLEQITYGRKGYPFGTPVVTKWPGDVDTPKQDRPGCRIIVHCSAFVDHPKAVVHDVLLKLQQSISAKFETIPPSERPEALSVLHAMQFQPDWTHKNLREATAHILLLNTAMPGILCEAVDPTGTGGPEAGRFRADLPTYGETTVIFYPVLPIPRNTTCQAIILSHHLTEYLASLRGSPRSSMDNRGDSYGNPYELMQLRDALTQAGYKLGDGPESHSGVRQYTYRKGASSRGAVLVTFATPEHRSKAVDRGLMLLDGQHIRMVAPNNDVVDLIPGLNVYMAAPEEGPGDGEDAMELGEEAAASAAYRPNKRSRDGEPSHPRGSGAVHRGDRRYGSNSSWTPQGRTNWGGDSRRGPEDRQRPEQGGWGKGAAYTAGGHWGHQQHYPRRP